MTFKENKEEKKLRTRRITYYDKNSDKTLVFITNDFDFIILLPNLSDCEQRKLPMLWYYKVVINFENTLLVFEKFYKLL